ncbi:protein NTM1-like 9 [Salvia miltiorrhiza]|uniref:protein NTM1-like 9 n=1 Tax=Salvia miltiorrhiza TaxID=226208 RepID=UPI0025AD807D|nr:protein NTM1-like 9 [Salvia miltiorrhiza]
MKLEALPKGFRFRPTDEELVSHYLRLKINGHHSAVEVIPEIDVCKWEPWDLPALSVIKCDDPEWFFFCPRDKKYPNGYRSNRATEAGYWKATGKDRTIKSRKSSPSGHSHSHVIGLKKTLVFYRGRAPKGERTNWIMHEYRATEPDLDGTGPGQGDYVLCRLFHKADERLDNLKCDGVEHTVSVPSTDKSSPDDVSSDVFREPAMLDMLMVKEPGEVKKWFTDPADCLTPTNLAPVESCASDCIDHSGEEAAMEVSLPLQVHSMSEEATHNQFDDKGLGDFQSHSYADLVAPIGSPFAADFGYERNGLHFQDGTSEPDASLSELLEGLQNHGNCFYDESTSHKTFDPSGSFVPSHIDDLTQAPFAFCKDEKSPSFSRVQSPDHSRSCYASEEVDSSVNTVGGSFLRRIETFCHSNSTKDNDTPVSETGIKIRSRQPRNPPSLMNFTSQGTAPRRLRLWFGPRPESNYSDRSKEDESQSLNEQDADIAHKSDPNSAAKHGQNSSVRMPSPKISGLLSVRGGSGYMKAYAAGIYIAITVSVLLGIWICPKLHALQG